MNKYINEIRKHIDNRFTIEKWFLSLPIMRQITFVAYKYAWHRISAYCIQNLIMYDLHLRSMLLKRAEQMQKRYKPSRTTADC